MGLKTFYMVAFGTENFFSILYKGPIFLVFHMCHAHFLFLILLNSLLAMICVGNEQSMPAMVSRSVANNVASFASWEQVGQLFGENHVFKIDYHLSKALQKSAVTRQKKILESLLSKICFCDYAYQSQFFENKQEEVSTSLAQTMLMEHAVRSQDQEIIVLLLQAGVRAEGSFSMSHYLWNDHITMRLNFLKSVNTHSPIHSCSGILLPL